MTPFIPDNAPFTPEQRAWLNGFLAGLFSNANQATSIPNMEVAPAPVKPAPPLTILFGSQTGTAEMFAKTLAKEGRKVGFRTQVIDLLDYEPDENSTELATGNNPCRIYSTGRLDREVKESYSLTIKASSMSKRGKW